MEPSPPPSPLSPRQPERPRAPLPIEPLPVPHILAGDGAVRIPIRRVARPVPIPFGRGVVQVEYMYPHNRVAYRPPRALAVQLGWMAPMHPVLRPRHRQGARPVVAGQFNPPQGQEAQRHEAQGNAFHRLFPPGVYQIQEGPEPFPEGVFPVLRRVHRPAYRPVHLPEHLPDQLPCQRALDPPNPKRVVLPEHLFIFLPGDPLGEDSVGGGVPAEGGPVVACPPRLLDMAAAAHVYVTANYLEKILARELYYVGTVERLNIFLKSQWEPLIALPWINRLCHDLLHDLVLWLFNFSCDRINCLGTTILVFLFCVRAPKIIVRLPKGIVKYQLQTLNEELENLLDQSHGNLHTLDVTGLDPRSTMEYLGIILPGCTSLKVLILGPHATLPVLMAAAECPLTTLDIDEDVTYLAVGDVIEYLLSSGPDAPHAWSRLVTLRLNHCEVSARQVESLLMKYIHLKTLTSSKLHIFNVILGLLKKEAEVGYIRKPMSLRQISVRGDWREIIALLRSFPKLSHIEMNTYHGTAKERECMMTVANMQTVISITIKSIPTIGPQVLRPDAFIPVGKHLQELKFSEIHLMSLSDAIYILMACPNLLSLTLSITPFDTLERDIPAFTHRSLRYLYLEETRKEPCYLHSLLRRCPSLGTLILNFPKLTCLTNLLNCLDFSLTLQDLEALDISRVGQITPLSVKDMRVLCCRRDCDRNLRRFLYVGSKIHPRSKEMSILRNYWWVRTGSLGTESFGLD